MSNTVIFGLSFLASVIERGLKNLTLGPFMSLGCWLDTYGGGQGVVRE